MSPSTVSRAGALPPGSPGTDDARLRRQRVALLLEATPAIVGASLAAAVGAVAVGRFHHAIVVWILVLFVVTGLRCLLCRCWRRGSDRRQAAGGWLHGLCALALAAGMVWGGLPVALAQGGAGLPIGFGILLLGALGVVGSGWLAAHFPAFAAFVAGLATSTAAGAVQDERASLANFVAVGLVALLLLAMGRGRAALVETGLRAEIARAEALREAREARWAAEREAVRLRQERAAHLARLRIPLHSMLGYAQLGRERVDDPTARRYFERIGQSGDTVFALLDDMQALAAEGSVCECAEHRDDGGEAAQHQ